MASRVRTPGSSGKCAVKRVWLGVSHNRVGCAVILLDARMRHGRVGSAVGPLDARGGPAGYRSGIMRGTWDREACKRQLLHPSVQRGAAAVN
jgi:hypothetical protein